MNKREWIDELKKINNAYKIEEKGLINSYLNEDFHLNKIFNTLLKDEVEMESKILKETIVQLKNSIGDVYSFFKGNSNTKIRNYDIRGKIYKIEEAIGKNRCEFRNKFESLLIEEEKLEIELAEFEEIFNLNEKIEDDGNGNSEEQENVLPNKKSNISKNDKIDEYISHIMNSAHIVFDELSSEEVYKVVNRMQFKDSEDIKSKINIIDQIIDKNLGGINLTWQARDQQEFLKLRASHNLKINTFEFLNDLENALPFLPKTELKNHIKIFNKYYLINELKKKLINHYKQLKIDKEETEKTKMLEQINNVKRPSTANINVNKKSLVNENKTKLEEWKKQKLAEKKEKYEEDLRREQENKEKEKLKYIEKANIIKPMIEEYKKNKNLIENTFENSNLNQNKVEINQIDLERIKEKNDKLVEKKMLIIKTKSLNNIKKAENYTKYKLKKMESMDVVPSKLTEKTKGFESKQRKKYDSNNEQKKDAHTMANNVLGRMTRAVPEWRKALV